MSRQDWLIAAVIGLQVAVVVALFGPARPAPDEPSAGPDHLRAAYNELHFKPAAEMATEIGRAHV